VPLPLTALIRQLFQAAIAQGHGEEEICSTIQLLKSLTGMEVTAHKKALDSNLKKKTLAMPKRAS
jgi:hypothetical protein